MPRNPMLASFLAGIALGSWLASRWASDARRAASGFGWCQLGIAALSLAAFRAIDSSPRLMQWLTSGMGQAGIFPCSANTISKWFPSVRWGSASHHA